MRTDLRFRQIHLDFHTSEHIPGIGSEFDPDEFAATLDRARVNSVTCFARCHHGWIYFDTTRFPERRHPHLTRNLLREQIQACHARNIRVPIYVTVQWDHYTAGQHPEWLAIDETGRIMGTPPFEAGFYRELCVNSPYIDSFLKPHVQEILETVPTDGFFFDIVRPLSCACRFCRAKMEMLGLDPADAEVRRQFGVQSINSFKQDMTRFVRQFSSDCTIFYNAGHVGPRHRAVADAYTHFELESLPSGGWGYLHFPITMRYARTLGRDCMAHTGKFHTSWGDFHSFKNPEALQYECFRMIALNSKCGIGDQLHPSGRIDPHVYALIGSVYSEVEKKEPWCAGARAVTEIGVFTPEEFHGATIGGMPPALMGVTRMLEESAHQFDIIDSFSDLSPYKVVVLPDHIPVSEALAAKLTAYIEAGGAVIASFESGMDAAQDRFVLRVLGVQLKSEGPRDLNSTLVRGKPFARGDYVEYVLPQGPLGRGLPETEHALYLHGMDVAADPGATVLAHKVLPYFDRTYQHFCSHRQTPSSGQRGGPAIVQNGRAIYLANPIFSEYDHLAPRWEKQLFLNALSLLLPEPLVQHTGPSTLQVVLNEQPVEGRWVMHLLHYIPERRCQSIDIIEDVIPLYGVKVSVRVPRTVQSVTCVPQQQALTFEQQGDYVTFVVPEINGHQMVALR